MMFGEEEDEEVEAVVVEEMDDGLGSNSPSKI
jgi:hypothetical protein